MFDPNTLSGILGIAGQNPDQAIGGVGKVPGMGQVPGMAPDNGGMAGPNPAAVAAGAINGPATGGGNPMASMMAMEMIRGLMGAGQKPQQAPAPSGGTAPKSDQVKLDMGPQINPLQAITMAKLMGLGGGGM